jgi:hypothetical protein
MTTVPANFVVETKFDGWRVCTHVADSTDASTISMHGRSDGYSSAMDERFALNVLHPLILAQVLLTLPILTLKRSSSQYELRPIRVQEPDFLLCFRSSTRY